MNYKKLLIIISLNAVFQTAWGQVLNKKQREYFILGTLDDYMGRRIDPREVNFVDRYDGLQGPLITVVDSLLQIDYSSSNYRVDRYLDANRNLLSGKIFSDTLAKRFNSYYTFEQSESFTSNNDPKLNNISILGGALKPNIFTNEAEKLAFLSGTYVRYGFANDTAYEISIANSYSKANVVKQLLTEFGCNPSYQIRRNTIPVGHLVYFHPSETVRKYLNRFMYVRNRLIESEKRWIDKMISEPRHR